MKTRSRKPAQELSALKKKPRSELPRRRRTRISPIVQFRQDKLPVGDKKSGFSEFSVDSNSALYFEGEVSCESSRVSVGSKSKPSKAILRKRKFGESEKCGGFVLSRSSYGGKYEVEVSESSCVESNNTSAGNGVFGENRRLKAKSKRGKRTEISKGIEEDREDSKEVSAVEISCVDNSNAFSDVKEQNEVVSCISGSESHVREKSPEKSKTTRHLDKREHESELCEVSTNCFGKSCAAISNSESTAGQRPQISLGIDSESLACSEYLSYDSQESDYSEDNLLESSDFDFSDYTPSIFIDSGSEFSERSVGDSAPSPTFALLLQYKGEFSRSTSPQDDEQVVSRVKEESIDQSRYTRFADDEDEESYQMLRNRERRAVILRDYVEDYSSTTEYGGLILQQRSHMVHWIVQHCQEKNLQQETMFLGVNLLDRFLSKGFFKSKRVLQIVGIACISLATRIEENQPYNSVRIKAFSVGSNIYSRSEVVAMEWLVQEVLNFQCFLPTIFNFLWFYLKAARAEEEVEKRAKYLAVLLLSDQVQMYYMPSTVAAAVVILASLEESQDSSIQNVIETHIRTKGDDLHECIESLEWLLRYV